MKYLRHPFFAVSLVACLLLAGGVFANQSTAHSLHHDHHKDSTHGSVICSWMCAAGQVIEVADPILDAPISFIRRVEVAFFHQLGLGFFLFNFDRGPPFGSL